MEPPSSSSALPLLVENFTFLFRTNISNFVKDNSTYLGSAKVKQKIRNKFLVILIVWL